MSTNKPLRRSRSDRMLGGVLGGVAQYYDLDPVLVRVVYVIITIPPPFARARSGPSCDAPSRCAASRFDLSEELDNACIDICGKGLQSDSRAFLVVGRSTRAECLDFLCQRQIRQGWARARRLADAVRKAVPRHGRPVD